MKNMQRGDLKFIGLFVVVFTVLSTSVFSQTSTYRLKTADSLFQAKRYTQSFELYESILKQNQYSSGMLLRMAYIQEGLNHIGQAMYYLNLYYLASRDKSALDKMEELAAKHGLEGYKATDTDRFLSFYHDYYFYISASLAAIAVLLLSMIFYMRVRRNIRPVFPAIVLVIIVIVLGYHTNISQQRPMAIITNPNTYFMEGPSAGAPVVQMIGDGHRVQVLGQNDVWIKIKWDNNTGYVKGSALQPVTL